MAGQNGREIVCQPRSCGRINQDTSTRRAPVESRDVGADVSGTVQFCGPVLPRRFFYDLAENGVSPALCYLTTIIFVVALMGIVVWGINAVSGVKDF